MNRRILNIILECLSLLFVIGGVVMFFIILFADVALPQKENLLVQILLMVICCLWLSLTLIHYLKKED